MRANVFNFKLPLMILIAIITISGANATLIHNWTMSSAPPGADVQAGSVSYANGYCEPSDTTTLTAISIPSNVSSGTWYWEWRLPNVDSYTTTYMGVYPISNDTTFTGNALTNSVRHLKGGDEHLWLDYLDGSSNRYPFAYTLVEMCGSNYYPISTIGDDWHNSTVIHREEDGAWLVYLDGVFVANSLEYYDVDIDSEVFGIYMLDSTENAVTPAIRNIKIYDSYEYPDTSVTYDGSDIVVTGYDVTPAQITSAVNNTAAIEYSGGKYLVHKNLHITRGSSLMMTGEEMQFTPTSDGSLTLWLWNGAALNMSQGSVITSSNTYYYYLKSIMNNAAYYETINGYNIIRGDNALIMDNSTISKARWTYITSPTKISITNNSFIEFEGANWYPQMFDPIVFEVSNSTFIGEDSYRVQLKSEVGFGLYEVYDSVFDAVPSLGDGLYAFINCDTGTSNPDVSPYSEGVGYIGYWIDTDMESGTDFVVSEAYDDEIDYDIISIGTIGYLSQTTNRIRQWTNDVMTSYNNADDRVYFIAQMQNATAIVDYSGTLTTSGVTKVLNATTLSSTLLFADEIGVIHPTPTSEWESVNSDVSFWNSGVGMLSIAMILITIGLGFKAFNDGMIDVNMLITISIALIVVTLVVAIGPGVLDKL